jgi:hypothetical protein
MIRQAINCDMCGAERVESTSYWFVADEFDTEIRLRGWESPTKSRKNVKHLCGQKCVQRLMDNFTAAMLAGQANKIQQTQQTGKAAKVVLSHPGQSLAQAGPSSNQDYDDISILERMGYDRETIAMIEAESWAGPARPKDPKDELIPKNDVANPESRAREKGLLHTARIKPQPVGGFRTA